MAAKSPLSVRCKGSERSEGYFPDLIGRPFVIVQILRFVFRSRFGLTFIPILRRALAARVSLRRGHSVPSASACHSAFLRRHEC